MMKKIIVMMLALAMVSGICSCSEEKKNGEVADTVSEEVKEVNTQNEEETEEALPATTEETAQTEPISKEAENEAVTADEAIPEPAEEEAPAPEVKTASKETASQYIGQSVSALVAAIGQPNNKTYASSCIGDGEDGEWYYDGFTVYTYRENGNERVEDVF